MYRVFVHASAEDETKWRPEDADACNLLPEVDLFFKFSLTNCYYCYSFSSQFLFSVILLLVKIEFAKVARYDSAEKVLVENELVIN